MRSVMEAEVLLKSPDEAPFDKAEDDLPQLFSGDVVPVTESVFGVVYQPDTPPTVTEVDNPHVEFVKTWIALGISLFMMTIGTLCFIVALEGSARRAWMQSSVRRWFSSVFPRWFPAIEEPAPVQEVLNLEVIPPPARRGDAVPDNQPVDHDAPEVPDAQPVNPEVDDVPKAAPRGSPYPYPRGLPRVVDPEASDPEETPEDDRPNAQDP